MTDLAAAVTTGSLNQIQLKLAQIIQGLGFGTIEGLSICAGQPRFDTMPRIVQSIKLGARPEPVRHADEKDTLKRAFVDLFERLSTLSNCTVDIEVQHGLPFRLILERSCEEFD
jgi:hypothetical protein